jgi:hypothetical protein
MDIEYLNKLRRRYIDAAQRSSRCAYNVDLRVARGTPPSDEELRAQRDAHNQLVSARVAYLHALTQYKQAL